MTSFLRTKKIPMGELVSETLEVVPNIDGTFPSMFWLFMGAPRHSAKTCAGERVAQIYKRTGAKIIFVCDQKDELEPAFSMFEPEAEYHKRIMEFNQESPETFNVRINHPFTTNIPNRKEPETNYFSIPIRSGLHDNMIKFILEDDRENTAFNLLKKSVNDLKNNEGLFALIHNLKRNSAKSESYSFFMTEDSGTGTQFAKEIELKLENLFVENYFLMPESSPTNIDIKRMLKDKDVVDVFTTRHFGKNSKVKDFITFYLLEEIQANKKFIPKEGILLVMQEIKDLCPQKPSGYKVIFINTFNSLMTKCGSSKLGVIADTQSESGTNRDLMPLLNMKFVGKTLSNSDQHNYATNFKFSKDCIEQIKKLELGEFIRVDKSNDNTKIKFAMPCFMHHEEGVSFDKVYERKFPEKMKSYYYIVDGIRQHIYEQRMHYKEINDLKKAKVVDEMQKKLKETQRKQGDSEKVEKLKEELAEKKRSEREDRDKKVLELHVSYPNLKSRGLSELLKEKYGISLSHTKVNQILNESKDDGHTGVGK
jgi:hypothetical protein